MKEQTRYIINQLLNSETYSFDEFKTYLVHNPNQIKILKQAIVDDENNHQHQLILRYITFQPRIQRRELIDEVCKIYRKPFLTHRSSLSRVLIVNQEVFLHIIKNDVRFFIDGPERTSVNIIEESLNQYLGTFYPQCFSKDNKVRKKEIYDALRILEDESIPQLITTTRLKPGTGMGKRRRKRYCMTNDGFQEILPLISIVIRDELEHILYQM
jgi:hypothetical protein